MCEHELMPFRIQPCPLTLGLVVNVVLFAPCRVVGLLQSAVALAWSPGRHLGELLLVCLRDRLPRYSPGSTITTSPG
jgi:hypothetical protein